MTTRNDSDLDQMLGPSDPAMQRVISDLERACATSMPPDVRAAIARRLAVEAREPKGTGWPGLRRRTARGVSRTLLSLAAAAAIVVAGVVGYLRLEAPTPASAAQILQRGAAAVMGIPAGDVVHEVTQIHVTQANGPAPNDNIRFEQWTQVDADGRPVQYDLQAGSPNPALDERTVAEAGGVMWTYGATPDVVTKSTWTPGVSPFTGPPASDPEAILFLPKETLYAPQDPKVMHDLLTEAASGAGGNLQLLPQQTVDGRTVDVVRVTRTIPGSSHAIAVRGLRAGEARVSHAVEVQSSETLTIYLDASTYLVRRIDLHSANVEGTAAFDQSFDVTTYEVVPVSAVPPGTFTFTPAPGTKVCTPLSPTGSPGSVKCTTVTGTR